MSSVNPRFYKVDSRRTDKICLLSPFGVSITTSPSSLSLEPNLTPEVGFWGWAGWTGVGAGRGEGRGRRRRKGGD